MKFVDITNDVAFRKIFGNQEKKTALISFLNVVIKLPGQLPVEDIEILNPYQLPKLAGGKATILDVNAKDKNGNAFIVEMQVAELEHFQKRVLYYMSQGYVGQIQKGADYRKLSPAYFIGILDFIIGNNPNYYCCHQVLDVETGERVIQDMEFHFIELPKFNLTSEQLQSGIDQWTYFIKNAENLDVIPQNTLDEGLRQAYEEADKHSWSQQELEDYERMSIREGDDVNKFDTAIKRKSLEIAVELLRQGVAMEVVSEATQLEEKQILKFQSTGLL